MQINRTPPLRGVTLPLSQNFFFHALTFITQTSSVSDSAPPPLGVNPLPFSKIFFSRCSNLHNPTFSRQRSAAGKLKIICSDTQFVRDSGRTAKAPPQPCPPAECG